MRYRLRTLLMLLALAPPVLAVGYYLLTGGRNAAEAGIFLTLAALWAAIACWPRFMGKGG